MASTTFPLLQAGSFTGPTSAANIKWTAITGGVVAHNTRVVTGSGDTAHVLIHGIPYREITVAGVVRQTSGGSFGLGQSSTITQDLNVKCHDWVIRKYWPLEDVTGTGDTEKNWTWGIPWVGVNVRGTATSNFDEDDLFDDSISVSMAMNLFGTVAGTLKLDRGNFNAPYIRGGRVPFAFNGRISDGVTYSGSTNFSWLFPSPDSPLKETFTADIDTSANISNSVLLYDVTIRASAQDGGELPIVAKMRFDQPAP